MCGVCAILYAGQEESVSPELLDSLFFLQHRGQDAAGIVTSGPHGRLYQCKGTGMARDVFTRSRMSGLVGNMGIAHLRYPTAGSSARSEAQPFYVNSPYGIVLSHNGNLINAPQLKEYLDKEVHRHINTDSDSELLLNVFASELQKSNKARVNDEDLVEALKAVYRECKGAYACALMLAGYGIIGFRDPHGIRPLLRGERLREDGKIDHMIASESVVLKAQGYSNIKDILPGQAVIISKETMTPVVYQVVKPMGYCPDIFEYVYFARPDSVQDGISVYRSRITMGDKLADTITERFGNTLEEVRKHIDVIIPVPDTSRTSTIEVSVKLGIPYREGFVKNRYVGRTFIMPDQKERQSSVRRKLNAMDTEFRGRNVMIVDDSIVRGTTSCEIVAMAREAGAKKVFFASCAPPIRNNHIYGIDLADTRQLVAYGKTEEEIAEAIGADLVIYQKLPDLIDSCRQDPKLDCPKITGFEVGVFTGDYVTGVPDGYMNHLEHMRHRNSKISKLEASLSGYEISLRHVLDEEAKAEVDIGLYNTGDYTPRG